MNKVEVGAIHADETAELLCLLEENRLPREGLLPHLPTTLVARSGGRLVASAALEVYGDVALLRSLAVEEAHRGAGLGIRMTREALDLARRLGVSKVILLTETAEGFFAKQGFRRIAREAAPERVRSSVEFASVCPTSAVAMEREMS
jgi:amino-acid N-acetyltransferase